MLDLKPEHRLPPSALEPSPDGKLSGHNLNGHAAEIRVLLARLAGDFEKYGIKPFTPNEVRKVLAGIEARVVPQMVKPAVIPTTASAISAYQPDSAAVIPKPKEGHLVPQEPDPRVDSLSDEEFRREWGLNGSMAQGNGGSNSKYEGLSSTELGELARTGDVGAFEEIFAQYHDRIYNLVYRLMGDNEEAKTLSSETFLRAYRAVGRLGTNPRIDTWLYRIARNITFDELRRRKALPMEKLGPNEYNRASARQDDDPEDEAMRKETQREVQAVLERISSRKRRVLELREFGGLSCKEIADIIGSTRGAVKSVLFNARREFKTAYIEMKGEVP